MGFLLMGLGALVVSCATALPIPTRQSASWASQKWPEITLESLKTGRSLYIKTCAACHNLHLPSELTPERWGEVILKMQPRAHIDDATRDLILRYIQSAAIKPEPD